MAISGDSLFWGRGWSNIGGYSDDDSYEGRREGAGGVMRQNLAGGEASNLSESTDRVAGVAVDQSAVYWIDELQGVVAKKPLTVVAP